MLAYGNVCIISCVRVMLHYMLLCARAHSAGPKHSWRARLDADAKPARAPRHTTRVRLCSCNEIIIASCLAKRHEFGYNCCDDFVQPLGHPCTRVRVRLCARALLQPVISEMIYLLPNYLDAFEGKLPSCVIHCTWGRHKHKFKTSLDLFT